MQTKFTPRDVSKMISMIEERPCLWLIRSKDYSNREKKSLAFQEIGDALDVPAEVIEKKLSNLRTYWTKEESKVESSRMSGAADENIYVSPWQHFEELSFLRAGGGKKRSSKCNLSRTEEDAVPQTMDTSQVIDNGSDQEDNSQPQGLDSRRQSSDLRENSPSETDLSFQITCSSRKRPPSAGHKRRPCEKDNAELAVMSKLRKVFDSKPDSDELFGRLIGQELTGIPNGREKELLKLNIQSMIFDAKFPTSGKY